MALITCPECSNRVSERAVSCPKCGCPITSDGNIAGYEVPTIVEETSKDLKIQILLSMTMLFIGLVWAMFDQMLSPPDKKSYLQGGIALVGLLWYLKTRFQIWWHHK